MNEIINADCFDYLPEIADGSIDCVLTDPPYGVTACEWDVVPDLDKLWSELLRVGKSDCQYIMFSQQPFTTDLINSNRKMFKYDLIYEKSNVNGHLSVNFRPLNNHEQIIIFNKKIKYNIIKDKTRFVKYKNGTKGENYGKVKDGKVKDNGGLMFKRSIFRYNNTNGFNKVHPTQKPLLLIKDLLRMYSNEDDLILDPFSGSGVLAVAAYETKRNFICIEKDKEYYERSRARYNEAFKQILI